MPLNFVSDLAQKLRLAKANPLTTYNIRSEPNPRIRAAMLSIYQETGDVVENKFKRLRKYGLSRQVQANTETLLMTNKTGVFTETLVTANVIDKVVCPGFTGTFNLQYHTIEGVNLTFGVQTVTVTAGEGTLDVPAARVSRAENFSSPLPADLYIYEDSAVTAGVPDDGTKIHLMIEQRANHSLKASTSISASDYYVIERIYGSLLNKQSAFASLVMYTRSTTTQTAEDRFSIGTSNGAFPPLDNDFLFIVKPNEDVYGLSTADANGREVSLGFAGYLLQVRN